MNQKRSIYQREDGSVYADQSPAYRPPTEDRLIATTAEEADAAEIVKAFEERSKAEGLLRQAVVAVRWQIEGTKALSIHDMRELCGRIDHFLDRNDRVPY